MSRLARVAIASTRPEAAVTPLVGALVECLRRESVQTQLFHDRAVHACECVGQAVSGRSVRYLDSWLTPRELCREYFLHGSAASDLSILLGSAASRSSRGFCGGQFDELVDWLDLPVIALVDAEQFSACRLPMIPSLAKGVLLEGVADHQLALAETEIETFYGLPVIGALPPAESLGRVWKNSTDCRHANRAAVEKLADLFAPHFQMERFRQIVASDPVAAIEPQYFRPSDRLAGVHVALAHDQAIHCYFPGVLDLLELHGARVTDFSPLVDEALPADCNLVYLGCGPVHRFAERLAQNQCLKMSLHRYVEQGGRLFAEGGGLALLSEQMQFIDGRSFPGVGIFPTSANFRPVPTISQPSQWLLPRDHWLGPAGATLRGYSNKNWDFQPLDPYASPAAPFLFEKQAVGSSLHVNFSCSQSLLERFAAAATQRIG